MGTAQEIFLEAETLIETLLQTENQFVQSWIRLQFFLQKRTFKKSQLLSTSHLHEFKRSEVIVGLSVKIKFWYETPYSLVDTPKLLGGMCSPRVSTLISWRWRQNNFSRSPYLSTQPYGVIPRGSVFFTFTALRTYNLSSTTRSVVQFNLRSNEVTL